MHLTPAPVIQFAKLSGFSPIITTASKHNEAYLHTLGATHVLDRASTPLAALSATVRAITNAPVRVAFDAISDADTQAAAYAALAPGGQLVVGLPPQIPAELLTAEKTIVQVFGSVHVPEQKPVGLSLYKRVTALLEAGDIKVCSSAGLPLARMLNAMNV